MGRSQGLSIRILLGGSLISAVAWYVTRSMANSVALFVAFIGIAALVWWDAQKAADQEATTLDSLRRSLKRQLSILEPPSFLTDLVKGGLPNMVLATPIDFVADLRPATEISARNPGMEDLYTWLIEVNVSLAQLRYLSWMSPILRSSAWAVQGTDQVRLETQNARPEEREAVLRQYKIMLWPEVERGNAQVRLYRAMGRAAKELERVLRRRYGQCEFAEPPPLSTEPDGAPLTMLRDILDAGKEDTIPHLAEAARSIICRWQELVNPQG